MRFFILFFMALLPFSDAISFATFLGKPVITWLELLLFAISVICVLFPLGGNKQLRKTESLLLFIFVAALSFTFLYSFFSGWSLSKCLTNMAMYALPFTIYPLISKYKITLGEFTLWFTASMIVAAGISLLVYWGVLETGHSSQFAYNVNTAYVDGASGVLAITLFAFRLANRNRRHRGGPLVTALLGICGSIVVLLGQSRGRVLVAVLEFFIVILLTQYVSKRRKIKAFMSGLFILGIASVGIWLLAEFSAGFSPYVDRIVERLSNTDMSDVNVQYRLIEMRQYLKMFESNPIFGRGWGVLNNSYYLTPASIPYRAHNMYVALLGTTGLIFTVPFCLLLLHTALRTLVGVKRRLDAHYALAFASVSGIVLLGFANAGFGKLAGILFMVVVYTSYNSMKARMSAQQ